MPLDHTLFTAHSHGLVAAEQRGRLPDDVQAIALAQGVLADSANLMPVLVDLRRLSEQQRRQLIEAAELACSEGEGPLMTTLLTADVETQRLAGHLARMHVSNGPAGVCAWLRLHDPRVWVQLPRVLGHQEAHSLLGPIKAWTVYLHGKWMTTRASDATSAQWPATTSLRAEQWAALSRVGCVNRVLARNGWWDHEDILERSAEIDELVVRAQARHGLRQTEDLVAYACLGLQVHSRFDEHPIALEAIETLRGEQEANELRDATAMDALSSITHEQWAQVRLDLLTPEIKGAKK